MWVSKRGGIAGEHRGSSGMAQVTIGGASPAVQTEGELREAAIISPGAFFYWTPEDGGDVLAVQAGDLCEETCLPGVRQKAPPIDLRPGEMALGIPGSYLHIGPEGVTLVGSVRVRGTLTVDGTLASRGELKAEPLVRLDGAVFINGIYQIED